MIELAESVPKSDPAADAAKTERETPHTDLVRWAWTAVRSHGYARTLSAPEQEALVQQTLAQVTHSERDRDTHSATRPANYRKPPAATRAADVLAWLDYAGTVLVHLDTAASLPLARLTARQRYRVLQAAVQTALESPHWQDHSARYRSAAKAQRDSGPRVIPDAGEQDGLLYRAADAASAQRDGCPNVELLAPMLDSDWSACEVARALAYERGWTLTQARVVALALERARLVAGADAGAANRAAVALLESVAAQSGKTLDSVKSSAKRGVKLLATVPAEDALRAMRHVARLNRTDRPLWERVTLAAAAAADTAIRTHALAGGAWDSASIHSGRSLPQWPTRMAVVCGPWQQKWATADTAAA